MPGRQTDTATLRTALAKWLRGEIPETERVRLPTAPSPELAEQHTESLAHAWEEAKEDDGLSNYFLTWLNGVAVGMELSPPSAEIVATPETTTAETIGQQPDEAVGGPSDQTTAGRGIDDGMGSDDCLAQKVMQELSFKFSEDQLRRHLIGYSPEEITDNTEWQEQIRILQHQLRERHDGRKEHL